MKKLIIACVLMMVGISLAACGDKKESTEETNENEKIDTGSMKGGEQVITEDGEEATQFTMDDGTVMQENNQADEE